MADPVAWPFAPGGNYVEEFAWMTEVLRAPTGGTHHRRLRESPRSSLSFFGLESGRWRRWLDLQLRANSAGRWWVPVAYDLRLLGAAASAAGTTLTVAVDGARFIDGGYLLLVGDDPTVSEVCEIDTVGTSAITLAAGLANAWPIGTRVTPVRKGVLSDPPSVPRFTADDSGLVLTRFLLLEALDSDPTWPGSSYRGYPVFDFIRPVWTSDPVWSPERNTEFVDDAIGVPILADQAGVALGKVTMQYAPDTAAALADFRSALFALAGRWTPAWVPSWARDIELVADVSASATTIDIEGPLLSTQPLADNHRDIRIELVDGTVLYRRITGIATPDANTDRLTVDSALPAFTAAQVASASFLALCTQDTDLVALSYFTPTVAECELSWRELDHEL